MNTRVTYRMRTWINVHLTGILLVLFFFSGCTQPLPCDEIWTSFTSQEKPWTRWWWMGNIVNKDDITIQLEAFAEAGLGGVEITPIYGVRGYEDAFIDFLSPEWLDMLDFTLNEAERLGLGVDMILGTGWPYGGSQVDPEFAASYLRIRTYHLEAGQTFHAAIEMEDPGQRGLAELQYVLSYDEKKNITDLTPLLTQDQLNFTPERPTTLFAVFCAKTRQLVKRSAPGGAGYTLDHFSEKAFTDYTGPYEEVIQPFENRLRSIFNDSYEVYQADYTPGFVDAFREKRGYHLLDHLDLLVEKPDNEEYSRILCDYRETLSDLLLEDFAQSWTHWSNEHTFTTKYQAHGSPGNLIDLYAAADIPECEIFGSPAYDIPGYRRDTANIRKGDSNKMMLKFCSSAAHLQGKELVSSESFTWLREHFKTALSQCKPVADDFFFSGVNHIFLHGSTFSPQEAPWPGFKFYASVNFHPASAIWKDAKYLFAYMARCQSLLQEAQNDNDIVLYWPVYDAYSTAGKDELLYQYSIHSVEEWLIPTPFYNIADKLDKKGYGFDFISDRFIHKTEVIQGELVIDGKSYYKTLLVPESEYIPLETMKKLVDLKSKGAAILFMGAPSSVPGYFQYTQRQNELEKLIHTHSDWFNETPDLESELKKLKIFGEDMTGKGLKMIRKNWHGNPIYFIANHTAETVDQFVTFNKPSTSVLLLDPMTGNKGVATSRSGNNTTEVKLHLLPGESLFVLMGSGTCTEENWSYPTKINRPVSISGDWEVVFDSEGNTSLPPVTLQQLSSWTEFGPAYESFSGTATYTTRFALPEKSADGYVLDLGDVRESARVYVNDSFAGALIAFPFRLDITDLLNEGNNTLQIEVSNLSANRLRQLEISGQEWKIFYEINMVNIHYEPFDATTWDVLPSGILGNVSLIPVDYH